MTVPFDTGGAADIGSFNVTPAWEKPCPLREEPILTALGYSGGCQCGMCRAAAAGHL